MEGITGRGAVFVKKLDSTAIRQQNLHAIFEVLQHGGLTRQEIANRTHLSLMSVTNLVDQLQENQAITVTMAPEKAGVRRTGRKAESISLDYSRDLWLVINLSDLHFRYVVLQADRRITYYSPSWPYVAERSYEENLRNFLRDCARFSRERIAQLVSVAVVLPGPFDAEQDQVINIRIPELNSLHVRQMVLEAFGNVYTYLDEDVKFAVRAYAAIYPEQKSLYYLYIGEGVGGALTYDGQVLYGLNSIMGDPGQLALGGGKTFEQRLSQRTFLQRLMGWQADVLNENQAAEALQECAESQPEKYLAALKDAAKVVAEILHLTAWLLDPHGVVIDCTYARPMQEEFTQAVMSELAGYSDLRRLPELCPLKTYIDASYFGAVKALEKHWIATMK